MLQKTAELTQSYFGWGTAEAVSQGQAAVGSKDLSLGKHGNNSHKAFVKEEGAVQNKKPTSCEVKSEGGTGLYRSPWAEQRLGPVGLSSDYWDVCTGFPTSPELAPNREAEESTAYSFR